MTKRLCAGLLCLAVGILLGGEANAQEAETAKSQTASPTEASRPALDLVDQAEQAQSAKDNAPSGKGKSEEPATSISTTSTVTASGSTVTAGGAIPNCYINKITYNGTTITFYREARSDVVTYATGLGLGSIGYRIKTVDVLLAEGRVAAYKLSYETSSTSGSSRLTSVQEYGTDAVLDASGSIISGTSLPAHVMSYSDAAKIFTTGVSFSATTPHFIGDFNGDTQSDYANTDAAGTTITSIHYNAGSSISFGFNYNAFYNLPYNAVRLYSGDFTADHRSDFLTFYGTSSMRAGSIRSISIPM